jgi:hypothetical protein
MRKDLKSRVRLTGALPHLVFACGVSLAAIMLHRSTIVSQRIDLPPQAILATNKLAFTMIDSRPIRGMTYQAAFDEIQRQTGIRIDVDWAALDRNIITPNSTFGITAAEREPAMAALRKILRLDEQLYFRDKPKIVLDGDGVRITTVNVANKKTTLRLYDSVELGWISRSLGGNRLISPEFLFESTFHEGSSKTFKFGNRLLVLSSASAQQTAE